VNFIQDKYGSNTIANRTNIPQQVMVSRCWTHCPHLKLQS